MEPKKLQKQVDYMEGHPGGEGGDEQVRCGEEGKIMDGIELLQQVQLCFRNVDAVGAVWKNSFGTICKPWATTHWVSRTSLLADLEIAA